MEVRIEKIDSKKSRLCVTGVYKSPDVAGSLPETASVRERRVAFRVYAVTLGLVAPSGF